MKNLLITTSVLLGLSGTLCSFASHAAPPTVSIDFPAAGQAVSGIVSVNGWAAGTPSVNTTKLYVDGIYYGDLGYGGSRDDVKNALPTVANAGLSGFSAAINTRLMTNGSHTLEIRASNTSNEVTTQSVTVTVSNAPGTENPTSVNLSLTGATARMLDASRLVIEKAKVNGKSSSVVLEFNTGTNNFVISSFANDTNRDGISDKTNCPNDRDCDGVPDTQDSLPDNGSETSDSSHSGLGDNAENDNNETNRH